MNNLLVGNGINIQFNKTDYTTQQIVLRILKNCDRDDFPSHIIVNFPYLLKNYIGQLFLEARDILEDKYDNFTNCTAEDESLKSFKKQYADKIDTLRITDIGFEDYYLIHDLVCHKTNTQNPEQYYVREALRVAYLYLMVFFQIAQTHSAVLSVMRFFLRKFQIRIIHSICSERICTAHFFE